jgi:hypothetical protein
MIKDQKNKNEVMSRLDLAQIKSESDSWKRSLNFMIDENIHLKGRLTQILRKEFNKDLLEVAENFHNNFIKQDELIGLLRNDIAELDALLLKGNKTNLGEIKRKLTKLRDNLSNASKEFDQLKIAFNDYLAVHI